MFLFFNPAHFKFIDYFPGSKWTSLNFARFYSDYLHLLFMSVMSIRTYVICVFSNAVSSLRVHYNGTVDNNTCT